MTVSPLPFILDTDYSSDIDDCGDLTTSTMFHRQGWGDLKGVILCSTRPKAAGAIQAVLVARGLNTIPIGTYQPGGSFDPNGGVTFWADHLYDNFPHPGVALSDSCTNSTTQYRTLLAAAPTTVTIIGTGFFTALDDLINSPADGISPLTGVQLIAAKVRGLYMCAGIWPGPGVGEFNLTAAPAEAANVVNLWPTTVPLIWVGIELGNDVGTTTPAGTLPTTDAVYSAYNNAGHIAGRTCWGQVAVACALEREAGFRRVRGTSTIDPSTGTCYWTDSATGPHHYVRLQHSNAAMQAHLQQCLAAPATGTPAPAWSSSYAPVSLVAGP